MLTSEEFQAFCANREPIDGKLAIADLTPLSCRWPSGNPRDPATFRYCGAGVLRRGYCARHARLAYAPKAG